MRIYCADMKRKPTLKRIEKLRTKCADFGMDFKPLAGIWPDAYECDELEVVLRWSNSKLDNPSREQIREALKRKGCHCVEVLQNMAPKYKFGF